MYCTLESKILEWENKFQILGRNYYGETERKKFLQKKIGFDENFW